MQINLKEKEGGVGMSEKHKIKIIQNKVGTPKKIFIDEKEIMGVDRIDIRYSHDFNNENSFPQIEFSLIVFDKLEIITQDV